MKRILITTMHRGNNYGSALQTYALSERIKAFGATPVVLDYIPQRINYQTQIRTTIKDLISLNGISKKYNALRSLAILTSSHRMYDRFFRRELNLTAPYYTIEQLDKSCPDADVYMTGSDQVWNSFHNQGIEEVFYLGFVPDNCLKVAYAASFGRDSLEEWEIKETQRLLSRYDVITVREQSGIGVLNSIGLKGRWVLDPTFLLDKTEWEYRSIPHNEKDRYVMIYSVEPDKQSVIKVAREIADHLNAKVYMVEWGRKPYPGVDKMISLVDPLQLIDYFAKAEYIVASSFHGTALSLNLNKQFISLNPAKFNTRVKSILELVGEESRLITPTSFDINAAMQEIDYTKVNSILNAERVKSNDALKQLIR